LSDETAAAETTDAPLMLELAITPEAIAALAPDYAQLCGATGNRSPFALHRWHRAWCAHFLRRDAHLQDHPLFYVFRDAQRRCVAIVPLVWTVRRLGPFPVRSIDLLGADPALTALRGPLLRPGCERAVVRGIQHSLARLRGWHWVNWAGVGEEFAAALEQESRPTWYAQSADFVLDLPDSWTAFRTSLKRTMRDTLRHCYQSLEREGLQFEFRVAREPGAVRAALERFLELHDQRAHLLGGVRHANRFSGRRVREFLLAVGTDLADEAVIRIFELVIDSRVVASQIGFVVGDRLHLYYSGFDPAWARYSVITTTVAESIKHAIEQGLRSVSLSPGRDVGKSRWGPRAIPLKSGYIQRGGPLSWVLRKTYFEARFGNGSLARLVKYFAPARRDWS
jgi:CelD/BcsL family acetyltransferase involved in cellulose biosynthesis